METTRFDTLTKAFGRRLSRRRAVRQGAAGLAAGALGAAGLARPGTIHAQDASPVASPAASPAAGADLEYLFVQVFESGTFRPKEGDPGVYVLSFNHSSAQTILFSNRPARVVGTVPTARMAPNGEVPPVPPNAALVTRAADGAEDVLVVELIKPTYDEAAGTLSYDVRVLENYEEEGLRYLADKQGDRSVPEEFGPASLFIDDCPDGEVACFRKSDCAQVGRFPSMGHCGAGLCCGPCGHPDQGYWNDRCNQTFSACNGDCEASDGAWLACFYGGCGDIN